MKQTERLVRLGVTVDQVKAWAREHGHEVHRGPVVRAAVLDAYEATHA